MSSTSIGMYNNILVNLDTLLDTRLGTIAKMDKGIVDRLLLSDTYHTRDQDIFDGVDKTTFKNLYQKRDVTTLSLSMLTNLMPVLRHLVGTLKEQAIVRPFHDGAKIIVNMYPYRLTEEQINDICRAVAHWMQGQAPVTYTYLSPKELTPIHCKSNYALMIMYDYEEWLEVNAELFLKTQIPEISMFVPAIYFANKPTIEQVARLGSSKLSPMEAIEFLAKGIISLELINVAFFSILSDKYKDIKF